MKVKPLADRILVKPVDTEQKTAGGIYIPETAQEKTMEAVVVAVGDDKEVITVKVKDKVLHDKYAGTAVKIDGVDHLIVRMDDVLAVIE